MNIKNLLTAVVIGVSSLTIAAATADAANRKVVVAYQTDALPSSVAIANGDFAKETGYEIDFRKFNSGAEIFAAIASGDVQIGYVGSSPFAAAASRGLEVKAFYLSSISGIDEALVVRNDAGIESLDDLRGKKLAAAPVSTDHYQLLALIKSLGLSERDVQVFAIPQPEIVASYNRGDIDGGFVWDPALTELKKNGKVLVTSKDVADKGAPTFSAWVATSQFAADNPKFLKSFASVITKNYASFAADKAAWGPASDNAKSLAKLLGGTAEQQAAALKNLTLLTPEVQASDAWLGGGEKSGAAKILKDTATFLKEQGKVSEVLPNYGNFVTADALNNATN
ncbi:taurine ABC transporter substrate-binding protein [Rhizobium mongolense]|uniref:Taurine transport system substrate-binding protein n=2 Tax=Rhizobium mongolense TaxID=57676 RepID=A0ABR6IFA8_9HYPH|nr:taurine ABC transporter substrate-binding protein [Rhizobium mongolense]MBB4226547.1 taurine transport system substrate-binding protein [Rhizobium mongolense]TVZ73812.1 taurine transport system substrate-binding protein [Rhizobium mongolense USDA 1844]